MKFIRKNRYSFYLIILLFALIKKDNLVKFFKNYSSEAAFLGNTKFKTIPNKVDSATPVNTNPCPKSS
ncbi:hypothetical protein KIMC2_10540 [Xylocopilactobacillus apis]|uniref:Uncharacterized protein n=1 Tax=Xylocopilactobacillus apis TaxID=2932183 RepID=A0AAU9D6W3_9LACO|nr:hypothetical protein KIMC2_10540 [Xylocopilactobacillus apis]